tara:strand:- start:523 stop:966 length:444 start_codon:yes stop_codon:yes gene_type:complete
MGIKRWSAPTWRVMHYIAANCKDNKVELNKAKNIISHIATILPCIICKSHAMTYLKKNKLNRIKNKHDLIMFMFKFHNNVKKRTHYPLANKKILELYKNKSKRFISKQLSNCLFIINMDTIHLPRQMNLFMVRSRIINELFNTLKIN